MKQAENDARFWDGAARKYAEHAIADPAGYERTLERTREFLKPTDAGFEFGCGTGSTAIRLAPALASLTASDISEEMIAIARAKPEASAQANLQFEVGAPDPSRFDEASLDVIFGFNVLHLMRDRMNVYLLLHRMLKPNGLFISKTPCLLEMNPLIRLALPVAQFFGKAPFVSVFDGPQLAAEIEAAGFDILHQERHGSKRKDFRLFLVARRR